MSILSDMRGSVTKSKAITAFAVVAIGGAFAYSYFKTPEVAGNHSTVQSTGMNQPTLQGSEPITPVYKEALEKQDQQRVDDAKKNGGSAIPTIQSSTQENEVPLLIDTDKGDKTPKVPNPVPEIMQQPIVMQQPLADAVPIVTTPPPAAVAASPERITKMVAALTRPKNPVAEVVQFGYSAPKVADATQSAPSIGDATTAAAATSKIKLPLAGTILYAQLVGRANSDHPGPVIAKVLQGEYTGATLIGSFAVAQNALVINFDRMTVEKTRDGEEINETVPLKAVAVDTKYIGTGLATSVDRHLFEKLSIAAATSFAQTFGQAVTQKGQTSTNYANGASTNTAANLNTNEELLSAGGSAIGSAGQIMQSEFGQRPTTVIVDGGTPLGVLFL